MKKQLVIPFIFVAIIFVLLLGFVFLKQKSTQQPAQSSGEQKIVCMAFYNLEEALENIDIACVLDLQGKGLTDVPADITKLTKLNELSLKNNNLSSIPPSLLQIPTLFSLDLSENQIESLPEKSEIKLEKLQSLDLSQNKLTSFPWTQTELPELRFLKLGGNNLSGDEQKRIERLFPDVEVEF